MKIISQIIFLSLLLLIITPFTQASDTHVFTPPGFSQPDCNISTEQPYDSKFVEVLGHSMHYIEAGDPDGEVFLFLHGTPTYSYLWRNVMTHLVNHIPNARAIAFDSIGMGFSERPPYLDFTIDDHIDHAQGFIEALGLENVTLVLHDSGSVLGLTYANRYPDNVRSLIFMEALLPPDMPFADYNMVPSFRGFMELMLTPGVVEQMVIDDNVFLGASFVGGVICGFEPLLYEIYRKPWLEPSSRRVLQQLPRTLALNGEPGKATYIIENHIEWLLASDKPKLLLHADPGFLLNASDVAWLENNLKNLTSVSIGRGSHYIQETNPEAIGRIIAKWSLEKLGLSCPMNNIKIFGTSADDTVIAQNSQFSAGQGDDYISAAACDTRVVLGGDGNDTLTAGYGSIVKGQSGHDFLDGTFSSNNKLFGGKGNDTLWLGDGTIAVGGGDADTFWFFGSQSKVTGGYGKDRFIIAVDGNLPATNGSNIIMDFTSGDDSIVFTGFGDTLTGIDDLMLAINKDGLTISVKDKLIVILKDVDRLTVDDVIFE